VNGTGFRCRREEHTHTHTDGFMSAHKTHSDVTVKSHIRSKVLYFFFLLKSNMVIHAS